jgi:transcriptional regulator with XRE-family HTH domain
MDALDTDIAIDTIDPDVKEHERARAWRERLGLSVMQLEELSGYSREAIYGFEKGKRWDGKHSDFAWHRYKMACSAVERQITTNKAFDW